MNIGPFKAALTSLCVLLISTSSLFAADFLKVDDAFKTNITVENGAITASWEVADGYYLYEDTLSLTVTDEDGAELVLGAPIITPKGELKNDEFMGEVVVHHHDTSISSDYTIDEPQTVTVNASFQGCAEAGLCYPPSHYKETLTLPVPESQQDEISKEVKTIDSPALASNTSSETIENTSLIRNILIFFGLGLALSLTPCVLPMVPILSSLILGGDQQRLSTKRGFGLSTSYVLGMALVYTAAGLLVALSGSRLQIYMQHPYVLWPLAGAFVVLALSLLGAFEIRLPSSMHNKLNDVQNKIPGGQYVGVFLIGALSAIVVSPCVSAPLAGLLLYVAQEGDVIKGGISLFALAMGMGAPLIILGTTGANVLPKAGAWMNRVKSLFGFMMLFMALYLVKHLLDDAVLYGLSALILAFFGVWLGALHQTNHGSTQGVLFLKALGVCCLIATALLMHKATTIIWPSTNTSTQVSNQQSPLEFKVVKDLSSLQEAIVSANAAGQTAMVDVYADWCVACLEFEHKTFTDKDVIDRMQQMALIKVDITEDIETDAILDWLEMIGPPTLLFFSHGEEIKEFRVTGFLDAESFSPVLDSVLKYKNIE